MKTAVLEFPEFGLDQARLAERELGDLAANALRLRVEAISLNYRDLLMVQGHYNPRVPRPLVPCSDASCRVEEVGSEITDYRIGDRVITVMVPGWEQGPPFADSHRRTLGGPANGVCQAVLDLPTNAVLKVPDQLDPLTACCLPVAGLTAWRAIDCVPEWRNPPWILTLGTGGVSCFAAQIATAKGMNVIATSSSDKKLETMKQIGVQHGINYRERPEWDKAVLAVCPGGVDTVIEVGGAGTFNRSVTATRMGGSIAMIGVLSGESETPNLTKALMKDIRIQGILVGSRQHLARLVAFVHDHQMRPIVGERFQGLKQVIEAFRVLQQASHVGKLVVDLRKS